MRRWSRGCHCRRGEVGGLPTEAIREGRNWRPQDGAEGRFSDCWVYPPHLCPPHCKGTRKLKLGEGTDVPEVMETAEPSENTGRHYGSPVPHLVGSPHRQVFSTVLYHKPLHSFSI